MGSLHDFIARWLLRHSAEYADPRYAYARQMGEDAAEGLHTSWPEAEAMLKGIWRQESGGLSWDEARPAAYAGWLRGKRKAKAGQL